MSVRAWVRASRPLAQANLAMPLLLGQALAYQVTGRFGWEVLVGVALFGVLDQLFILYLNDYADREADSDARTPFSGGSGVLVDGALKPEDLRRAGLGAYLMLGGISAWLAWLGSGWVLLLYLAAGALLWLYSFPPARLSYRGHGEVLQGLGVGVVLPLVGYAAQAAELGSFPWPVLGATFLLGFAGNVATALPDRDVDRGAKKRTWPVRFGLAKAAWGCAGLTVAAIWLVMAVAPQVPERGWIALSALPILALTRVQLRRRRQVIAFVFAQGLSTQLTWIGWSLVLVYR